MSKTEAEPTEWTMAEAISFISATLGETYTMAQGNGLYWSALGVRRSDGIRPYPVGLETLGSQVKIILCFFDVGTDQAAWLKLYAIMGWAALHGHECEHD